MALMPNVPEEETSDGSLLRQLQEGSADAAGRLYQRYVQRLRALASAHTPDQLSGRIDADDIVQSVFRTFLQRAREGHYEVPSGEDLWGLLLVITLNKIRSCNDFHRAAKRDVRKSASMQALQEVVQDDSQERLLRLALREALDNLSDNLKAVVELRLAGHEVAEIARTLGRSKRTVERALQEALRRLRIVLQI